MQGRKFQLKTNVCANCQENTDYQDSGVSWFFMEWPSDVNTSFFTELVKNSDIISIDKVAALCTCIREVYASNLKIFVVFLISSSHIMRLLPDQY
jgi:hypothetical protein